MRLANRVAKAAMTENLAGPDNQPSPALERLYARWAAGGAGLLVTGNWMVDRRHLERSRNVVADALLEAEGAARLARACGDVPALVQLNHPGRQTSRFVARTPVAPSETGAVAEMGLFGSPRMLSSDEVGEVVRRFVASARRVVDAGFDGIQVHAAHGYLLAQFLSPRTNRRDDAWGGDLERRARPLLEVVRGVREVCGSGRAVSVKLNSSDFRRGGHDADAAEQVVRWVADEGVDLLEVSGGTYESPALFRGADAGDGAQTGGADGPPGGAGAAGAAGERADDGREAYFASFARRAKEAVDVPVMLTGGLRGAEGMRSLLGDGVCDVVGLARPLAVDPALPAALLSGRARRAAAPTKRPSRLVGLAGESEWYERQLGVLADGGDADLDASPNTAVVQFAVGEAWRGLTEGRRRRALARRVEV